MSSYSDYDPFARVYNQHWGNHFIPLVFPILEDHVLRYIPPNSCILDLCCGTGQLVRVLAGQGYQVTGLDGSAEMLRFARENAPDSEFIMADARTFEQPDTYQAVISTFDSLNHILELGELKSVFDNVRAALRPSGLFLFDLNMEAGFKTDWNYDFNIVEDDHVCVIRSSYHPRERRAKFEATIFSEGNVWQRSDFTLTQRCYSEPEVVETLKQAGFTEIQACACDIKRDLIQLTTESERAFFIGRKPAGQWITD
ncbi:MAG: class I SAM-dependent methyltransferase [Dehalococcoidales bacterium]|nr:SAM-dependent methyltransferase [Dehalococcoidales bacterium]MDP6501184.1 class I SAM-dependent methyltransferase [Dehalococcoidales bacterium]